MEFVCSVCSWHSLLFLCVHGIRVFSVFMAFVVISLCSWNLCAHGIHCYFSVFMEYMCLVCSWHSLLFVFMEFVFSVCSWHSMLFLCVHGVCVQCVHGIHCCFSVVMEFMCSVCSWHSLLCVQCVVYLVFTCLPGVPLVEFMYLVFVRQARVTVGDSGPCCCVYVWCLLSAN